MESVERRSMTTSRGFTFSYYISLCSNQELDLTLLLLHGFPDDALLWGGVIAKLKPCCFVIPDLLGYSGTSKPLDPDAYSYSKHTRDLVEILDAEGIHKAVVIGHDFGSIVAQRLYMHIPDRVSGLILLNIGYVLPSAEPPDLQKANERFEKVFGYPAFAYHEFFTSEEAPALLMANLDRFYDAAHGAPRDWMKEIWCTRGNIRKWLLDKDWKVEVRDYARSPALRQEFINRFRRDGVEAPLCYYKAMHSHVQYEDVKDLPTDRLVVRVPVLHVACTQDPVCRPEMSIPAKNGGFLPDLEEVTIDSGHWSPLERPDDLAASINSFLLRRYLL